MREWWVMPFAMIAIETGMQPGRFVMRTTYHLLMPMEWRPGLEHFN